MRELRLGGLQARLPCPIASAVEAELVDWDRVDGTRRLLAGDASLWSGCDEAEWLGWLEPGAGCDTEAFRQWRHTAAGAGWSRVVLLGMGGSSLGARLLCEGAHSVPGPRGAGARTLVVLDTTDAEEIASARGELDLETTLFVVASKSGTTVETVSLEAYFVAEMESSGLDVGPRVLAITDPGTELATRAVERGYHLLYGRADIGGRFSALSPFGLGVLIAMGVEPDSVVAAARLARSELAEGAAAGNDPGLALGAVLGALAKLGHDLVEIVPPAAVPSLADWLEQLLAESTGKEGGGILPIRCGDGTAHAGLVAALWNGRQVADRVGEVRSDWKGPHSEALGREIFRWQVATAVAGSILGVNPFDQADVDSAKVAAHERLSRRRDLSPRVVPTTDALARLVAGSSASRHVGVLAYLPRTAEIVAGVEKVRKAMTDATGRPVTASFGPRYLHSAGQLFKGGTPGAFLFITRRGAPCVLVPGSGVTFDQLQAAQASGDLAVLAERGRPVEAIELSGELTAGLDDIASRLRQL
ncbi:MAG: hypothetical protein VYE73_07350 [Acidobacteriota bacterium]|nr:hypothetical protein [Acidobacteriota bacterium]